MPYTSQTTGDPLEFTVIGTGTQIMSAIKLPTSIVTFGNEVVSQVRAIRKNSSSLSEPEGSGSIVLFHLNDFRYALLCMKDEITYGNNAGEILVFDVQDLEVQKDAYESSHIDGTLLGIVRTVDEFGAYDDVLHKQIMNDMKFVKRAAKPGKELCTGAFSETQNSCLPKIIPAWLYTIQIRFTLYLGLSGFFAILLIAMRDSGARASTMVVAIYAPCLIFTADRWFAIHLGMVDDLPNFKRELLLLCFGYAVNAILVAMYAPKHIYHESLHTIFQFLVGDFFLLWTITDRYLQKEFLQYLLSFFF